MIKGNNLIIKRVYFKYKINYVKEINYKLTLSLWENKDEKWV